jgi:hypothetical protein
VEDSVAFYPAQGLTPCPVKPASKRAVLKAWPKADRSFAKANLGIGLGDPSSGLVDVDLGSLKVGARLLPHTPKVFTAPADEGRKLEAADEL